MNKEDMLALLDEREKRQADEAKARADADVARKKETEDAIAAAKAKWETEAAKAGRLPLGAPYVARYADVAKYDHLDMGDLAFMVGVLEAAHAKDQRTGRLSPNALKALAIKIAEDKTAVGAQGRSAMKACGLDPDDVLNAAKANELDYTTQAGFGDEWVPQVWSARLWEQIRAQTFVLALLPNMSFEGPGDTFEMPLEAADPTWYRIGQATDLNATTGRPDATIGDSKLATDKRQITLGKVGARVPYSGEMDEDSIIPWVGQVRMQTEKSFAEQMEHLIIDGDTATGATTNINHIGGTPTSTGTKQDLFLTFNGFRKLGLVTTTANSRSAAGSLVDTDFIETVKLMGTAGLAGADVTKVGFIVDPNVNWKVFNLTSVKTRDVFVNATLENGMLKAIWGYKVYTSYFMHFKSAVRKANTAGKVDQTTTANNTTGSILAVRWPEWLFGYKRRMVMKLQDIPDSDAQQLIATARVALRSRNDEDSSAITYNVGV